MALVAAGLTSCDQDNEGAIYEPTQANISFIQAEQSTITKEASIEVPVAISRATTNGEGLAYAIVMVSNMEPGAKYEGTLTLSSNDVATENTEFGEAIHETTVTVQCDYNWIDAGMAHFVDYNWEDGWEADVPVINAERTNIYRIMNPLDVIYGDANGTYFEFYRNDDGTISVPEGYWNLNYWGYKCYYDTANYGAYCYIEKDGNTYGVNHLLVYGSSLYIGYFEFTYPK